MLRWLLTKGLVATLWWRRWLSIHATLRRRWWLLSIGSRLIPLIGLWRWRGWRRRVGDHGWIIATARWWWRRRRLHGWRRGRCHGCRCRIARITRIDGIPATWSWIVSTVSIQRRRHVGVAPLISRCCTAERRHTSHRMTRAQTVQVIHGRSGRRRGRNLQHVERRRRFVRRRTTRWCRNKSAPVIASHGTRMG